jgi:hypothetical protein
MSLTIIPVITITMIPGGAIHTGGDGRLLASGFIITVTLIGGIEIVIIYKEAEKDAAGINPERTYLSWR